jgi:WD40 repeat protein
MRTTGSPFVEKTRRYSSGSPQIRSAISLAVRYCLLPRQSHDGKVQGGRGGCPLPLPPWPCGAVWGFEGEVRSSYRALLFRIIMAGTPSWVAPAPQTDQNSRKEHAKTGKESARSGKMPRIWKELAPDRGKWSFGDLIYWHFFEYGTRPTGDPARKAGQPWQQQLVIRRLGIEERTLRNWIRDQHFPDTTINIETLIFGDSTLFDDQRNELRQALKRTRASNRTVPKTRVVDEVPRPTPAGTPFRIFISSPRDIADERLRAGLIIDKVAQDFARDFAIDTYFWECDPALPSDVTDPIETPSAFDLVVLAVWSTLGPSMPQQTLFRNFCEPMQPPVTVIEWAFQEASAAARANGSPHILVMRSLQPVPIATTTSELRAEAASRLDEVDAFCKRVATPDGGRAAQFRHYQTLDEFGAQLERYLRDVLVRRIHQADPEKGPPAAAWSGIPFRGLKTYEFEHAPIFFGRDLIVSKAAEQLADNARAGTAFLLVSGASGVGKSSLVQAALVPALMKPHRLESTSLLRRVIFRPEQTESDLIFHFAKTITSGEVDTDIGLPELLADGQTSAQLAEHLRTAADNPGFAFAGALSRIAKDAHEEGRLLTSEKPKLILVIDQLEELLVDTRTADERALFVRLLAGLARSGAVWVIALLRDDYWSRAAEVPGFLALSSGTGRIDIDWPSPAEIAEIIRKSANAAGLSFETDHQRGLGLDSVLAERAMSAPEALPMLSFALEALYLKDVSARGLQTLTFASYHAIGELEGAMANRADELVRGLSATSRETIPRVLRALITVSGTSPKPLIRTVPLTRFPKGSDARAVIDALVDARLAIATKIGEEPAVRLIHDTFLNKWPLARKQLDSDLLRNLALRTEVEHQYFRWSNASTRDKRKLFLREPDLRDAVKLESEWGEELDLGLRQYITVSNKRANRRMRLTIGGSAGFGVIIAAASILFFALQHERDLGEQLRLDKEHTAERAAILQASTIIGNAHSVMRENDYTAGVLLALEALSPVPHITPGPHLFAGVSALIGALQLSRERALFNLHEAGIAALSLRADGRVMLTASNDGTAGIWDAANAELIGMLASHKAAVTSATFSPDGRKILTTSIDGTARIWDAGAQTTIAELVGHSEGINDAKFSPNGKYVVTASDDGTARVWNIEKLSVVENIGILEGHKGPVNSVAISPDSRRIVTISDDGTARLWDARTREQMAVLSASGNKINAVTFSPDGDQLAIAMYNGYRTNAKIVFWDGKEESIIHDWQTTLGPSTEYSGHSFAGHTGPIWSVRYSADGLKVVSASYDGTARVWSMITGQLIAVLKGHERPVTSAIFDPDGRSILTSSQDGTVRRWRADLELVKFEGHVTNVHSGSFSPDGQRVATASADGTLRVWDANTGRSLLIVQDTCGDAGLRAEVAFSPDNRHIVMNVEGEDVRIWDAHTRAQIRRFKPRFGDIRSVSFSPDGRHLGAAVGTTARIWDVEGLAAEVALRGHDGAVLTVDFDPSGDRAVTTSADGTTKVWGTRFGNEISSINTPDVQIARYSPDGRWIVTASTDAVLRLWHANSAKETHAFRGHDGLISNVTFSPDSRYIVTASNDKTARLWDLESGKSLAILRGHDKEVTSAVFSSDGHRVLTGSLDGTARLWDTESGREVVSPILHEDGVIKAGFSPDGRFLITASQLGSVRIWDAITTEPNSVLCAPSYDISGFKGPFWAVAFSPDGARLLTGRGQGAELRDANTGHLINELEGHSSPVLAVTFSSDGQRALGGSMDKTARTWDAATGRQLTVFSGHDAQVNAVAFSPDGRMVLTGSDDRTARLWDAATGRPLQTLKGHDGPVTAVAFSTDGRHVVTASVDRSVRTWSVENGAEVEAFSAHSRAVSALALRADMEMLVTGSWDRTVRLWHPESGYPIGFPFNHDGWVNAISFSADGMQVLSTSDYGGAQIIWRFSEPDDFVSHVQRTLPRCLTPEQREIYAVETEPPAWCIEMKKWPYDSEDWRAWLKYKSEGLNPPMPKDPDGRLKWQLWQAGLLGGNPEK